MAMGASTNSTLHLPAIAHEAGIHITLDDFDELSPANAMANLDMA